MLKYCIICNKPFEVTAHNKDKKYCSVNCQHQSMQHYHYDVDNPPKCIYCGTTLPHKKANTGCKFCNMNCRRNYNKQQKQLKLDSLPDKYCEICGCLLSKQQILNRKRVCSASCAYHLRVKLYGAVSEANPDKFVQYSCINELRKTAEYKDRARQNMSKLWQNDDFRNKKIAYMKTDNPVYKDGVVEKSNHTKEMKGILHTWTGVRGGNGKISECEQLIYDFCILYGFEYNVAITTTEIRKRFPDEHYAFNYKPDFTNFKCKLCIEVDGNAHKSAYGKAKDTKKERCLSYLDYKFLRFSNDEIKEDINKVKQTIIDKLIELRWCTDG